MIRLQEFFAAIYDAWKIVLSFGETGIALKGMMNQELFCEYTESVESEKNGNCSGEYDKK